MRHILEIRLKNRIFEFIDFKGNFIDYLIKKTGYENVRITGRRIDVATKDLSEIIFFSWDNFGFQIEAAEDIEKFKKKNAELFSIIKSYGKYKFDYTSRIGTKTSIFNHHKGEGLETLREKYKNLFFKNNKELEKNIGFNLTDVGYFFQDLETNGNKLNLLSGPATKDEAIKRFFDNKNQYDSFKKDNGIFIDIDFFQLKEKKIDGFDNLKKHIDTNIDSIQTIFNGFIKYIEGSE